MTNASGADNLGVWGTELQKLGWFLGRLEPGDPCCGNLTAHQCEILRVLEVGEGTRLTDLAAATGISPSGMSRALERLEKQGLIRRVHGAMRDKRATTVELTNPGYTACCEFMGHMKQRTVAILGAIPAPDRGEILAALRKLNQAIQNAGCCGIDPVSALTSSITTRR